MGPSDPATAEGAGKLPALRALLAAVVAGNPFYARKLAGVGCTAEPASLEDFVARFPFTTKDELVADQAANHPYGTNLTFPVQRYVRCHQTSGTSGRPLRWLDTAESWSSMTDDWVEVLARAGITSGDRVFVAFSFGPFLGFWLAFEAAQRIGALVFPGGGMSSALRARVIAENRCTVLCCTPTYALHLAEASREAGIDPATTAIRRVVVAGEPGGSLPAVRDRISAAWNGSRVSDHHGMTETGPVTYEDPARPGALVMLENSFLAEVIDPHTLRPVDDGHRGELVLTTLRRTASPLIRYRTGDLVAARGTDGRLILEGGILGRVDDMLVVRGVNVYPAAVDEIVRSVAGTAEYRVTVDRRPALAALEIEIEGDATAANRLAGRLKEDLALRIPVTAVPLGALPRFELKAKRWRSSTGA